MKESYENKYHDIEKEHFWFKSRRNYIANSLSKSSKEMLILDVGCSSGLLLKDLEKVGFHINNLYGIDISEKAIENCQNNGIKNSFKMDAQNIILPHKFDVIIASDCLEHIENDQRALKNWKKFIK